MNKNIPKINIQFSEGISIGIDVNMLPVFAKNSLNSVEAENLICDIDSIFGNAEMTQAIIHRLMNTLDTEIAQKDLERFNALKEEMLKIFQRN